MFDSFFEVFLADTKEGREIHYNVRYQVYCEELGYEDTAQYPDKQEFDKWDPQSDNDQRALLFLVRLKHTKEWVGAMRLIRSGGRSGFPLQEVSSLDHNVDDFSVEVSRLCLVKSIRKPYIQNSYGIDEMDVSNDPLATKTAENKDVKLFYNTPKVKSTIIWGLFNAASNYCFNNNINKWYLLSSKGLIRIIRRQGFSIKQVGSTCEHRGSKRSPYLINIDGSETNPIWDSFNKSYRLYSELMLKINSVSVA